MIITLAGGNSFLLRAELRKRVADFVKENGDLALEKLDGEEVEFGKITDALQSLPFLSSKKLVVLMQPSTHKDFCEKFEELIKTVPETTDVIIVEPKIDRRQNYFKILQKLTDYREFNETDELSLKKWQVEYADKQGGKLSFQDAEYLLRRVGANQQLLANEIDKLLNYSKQITRGTIDLLTEPSPQSTIFELLDAALYGNAQEAMRIYEEQRQQKMEPLAILGMLAWQLHILALVNAAGERSVEQIATETKLHPFVVRKSFNAARKLDRKQIRRLVRELLDIDMRLKREPINADEAIKNYLLKLANS